MSPVFDETPTSDEMGLFLFNMKPRVTHEEFIKKLDLVHPDRNWTVEEDYTFNKTPLLLRDKYGYCRISPNSLLQRSRPSVKTALDKTRYTINKFKEFWGNKYSYTNFIYKGAREKSYITCRIHGDFLQDANMHLSGRCGCPECANNAVSERVRSNTKEFIEKAVDKYGDVNYSFNKTDYKSATEDVIITCKKHGDFNQTPSKFLNGQTCPRCSYKENSANFHTLKKRRNKSIFYIIECYNEEERFLKMGITTRSIKSRFKDVYDMPYKYNILREFSYANTDAQYAIETELLRFTKSVLYTPKIKFSGMTETREIYIKKSLLELFDVYSNQLYYSAFANFVKACGGVLDILILKSGNYSQVEINSVMKGYEIYKKLNL